MSYCQLNANGTFLREIFGGLIEWDANNYCSVDALVSDGKAGLFRIVPLIQTVQPEFDSATHTVARNGCEFTNGEWRTVWQTIALTAEEIEAARLAGVPQSVSPRQIRQALTAFGLRSAIETAIAGSDQDTKDWYEFATEFERSNPVVAAMASTLGVTALQLDDLWSFADSL